jgi:hypothetical protein
MKNLKPPKPAGRRKEKFRPTEKPLPPLTGYEGILKKKRLPAFTAGKKFSVHKRGENSRVHGLWVKIPHEYFERKENPAAPAYFEIHGCCFALRKGRRDFPLYGKSVAEEEKRKAVRGD